MRYPAAIPADVEGIRQIGVASWQNDFFWPVSDAVFTEMTSFVLSAFDTLYENQGQDREKRDILLCDTGFLAFLLQHLHGVMISSFCDQAAVGLIIGRAAASIYRPNWNLLSEQFDLTAATEGGWRFQCRRIAKHLKFNRSSTLPRRFWNALRYQPTWSLGSHSTLKSEYLNKKNLICDHPYVPTLLQGASEEPHMPFPVGFLDDLKTFFSNLGSYAERWSKADLPWESIRRCWIQRLSDLLAVYHWVARIPRPPRVLLLTETSSPMHKAVCLGLKRTGTRIVGFHHGNDMGNAWEKFSAYIETAHCDEFVCPTEAAARFHKQEYEMSGISHLNSVEFSSAESLEYLKIFQRSQKRPFPEAIRRVMVIGYPLNANRYVYSSGDFFVFQLDVELRVMRLLRERGIRAIYKVHPERHVEAKDLLENAADRILVDPFERVHEEADAFFFGCTTSTTFGFALCLNKPVFVLDLEGKDWNPAAYELLARRCVMIPAWFDERNRVQYDECLLVQRISSQPDPPDFSYVRQLMIPSGGADGRQHLSDPSGAAAFHA